jgi:3-oxoacyl-[acyl-carrier protein] reductase
MWMACSQRLGAAAKVLPDHGRIITIASTAGTRTGFNGAADYSATKAAVGAFNRVAARDLAARNITVNTLQAGFVDTDMNPENSDWAPSWIATVPLGRYGRPEEIAAGVVFLASPEASYVTGTLLNIDGGLLA